MPPSKRPPHTYQTEQSPIITAHKFRDSPFLHVTSKYAGFSSKRRTHPHPRRTHCCTQRRISPGREVRQKNALSLISSLLVSRAKPPPTVSPSWLFIPRLFTVPRVLLAQRTFFYPLSCRTHAIRAAFKRQHPRSGFIYPLLQDSSPERIVRGARSAIMPKR